MTDILDQLRRLDPAAGHDPAASVTPGTRTALLDAITATEAVPLRRGFLRHRVVPALVAASLLGGVALTSTQLSGDTRNEALAFRTEGDALKITIVDLYADTARFQRELRKHDLDFQLELKPVSPAQVGVPLVEGGFGPDDGGMARISSDPAGCYPSGTPACRVQISVPKSYRGQGLLIIGRPMEPGELAYSNGSISEKGEVLEGIKYQGLRVSQVEKLLSDRGHKVRKYVVRVGTDNQDRAEVPKSWFVSYGSLATPGEVTLRVKPRWP